MTRKKPDGPRIAQSNEDLKQHLKQQIVFLTMACNSFDAGQEVAGKYIALTLRVLFHQTQKSHSLLGQLKLREGRFLDTAGPLSKTNLLSDCNLTATRMTAGSVSKYIPLILAGGAPFERKVQFPDWWLEPVVKSQKGEKFTRSDLISHVCNTDGGAHVDPTLDEAYMNLSRNNSLGWITFVNGVEYPIGGPELACMRQIAHEVIETLKRTAPWAF